MGQNYLDYVQASTDAAHSALRAIHTLEELLASSAPASLQGFTFSLTQKDVDFKKKPLIAQSDEPKDVVTTESTSGNLTARTTVCKLAEARTVRDTNLRLPYPFDAPTIIPIALSSLLADFNLRNDCRKVADQLLAGTLSAEELRSVLSKEPLPAKLEELHDILSVEQLEILRTKQFDPASLDVLSTGKLQALTFDAFLIKKLKKRYSFMGSGFLALNSWNDSYSANKWVLHSHDDGQIVAEYLEVTNHVKKNHF